MVMPRSRDPDYVPSGTTLYALRMRQLSEIFAAGIGFAVPATMLTLVTLAYVTGHTGVAEIIYFGLFTLLAVSVAIPMLRDRAALSHRILLAVDADGVYLAEPPRRIPWAEVAGLVAFRTWQDGRGEGEWISRLVVVRPGEDGQPGAVERQVSGPDQWGEVVDLHEEKLRLRKLAAAVHTYAPAAPVWDAGKLEAKDNSKGQGQIWGQIG